MAEVKKIRLSDINPGRLTEELVAAVSVPINAAYHGFEQVTRRLFTVRGEPNLVTRRKDQDGLFEDFADPGEMRLRTEAPLSVADDAAADAAIAAHDETQLSVAQQREDKDASQLEATARMLQRANWDALSNAERLEGLRRSCMLLFREQHFDDLDTDD